MGGQAKWLCSMLKRFGLLIRNDYRVGGWVPKRPKYWLRNIWTVPNLIVCSLKNLILTYSSLLNNCAAQLINFLNNSSLHMLIWVCTFIDISEYSGLHIYSNLHNYWNWREILSSCKLIKICCKLFILFWIFLLLTSKRHLTLFVKTEIYRVCEKFSCLHIYSICTIIWETRVFI